MLNLPGDPTEAGPDTHSIEPPPDWDDLMMFAQEELQFHRYRFRAKTKEDPRQLVEAIMRAESFLMSAKEVLRAR